MPSVSQITVTVLSLYLVSFSSTLQPSYIQFNSSLAFYEDDSRILMQTKNVSMNYTMCLEYHLQIQRPGIRFQSYSCRTTGDDECISHSFNDENLIMNKENCYSLRAWTLNNYSYTFFFEYDVKTDRYLPHPHVPRQLESEESVTAILKLNNIKLCGDVCADKSTINPKTTATDTQMVPDHTIGFATPNEVDNATVATFTLALVNATDEFR